MPLSEVQRATPPLARGTPWTKWWYEKGHKQPSAAELRAWVANAEREKEQGKALLAQRREEAKLERKKIK